jgi:hypothetical protein
MTDFVERISDVPGFFPICAAQPEKRQADPPLFWDDFVRTKRGRSTAPGFARKLGR